MIVAIKNFDLKNTHFITGDSSVYAFLGKIDVSLTYIERDPDNSFKGLKRYRNKVREVISEFKDCKVYFFFYSFDWMGLYLIKCLSKNNEVYFENVEYLFGKVRRFADLFTRGVRVKTLNMIPIMLLTGIKFNMFKINKGTYFLGISPQRLYRRYKKFTPLIDSSYFKRNVEIVEKAYDLELAGEIVFFDNPPGEYFSADSLNAVIDFLVDKGFKFALKTHPSWPSGIKNTERFSLIRKEIPGEIIVAMNHKVCLGLGSSMLNYASKYKCTISILELVQFSTPDHKKAYVDSFSDHKGHIMFPKTLEELEHLIRAELGS